MKNCSRSVLFLLFAAWVGQSVFSQDETATSTKTKRTYEKIETRIKMRDGVELYTAIYSPADKSTKYPILMQRTPYGCWPYGDTIPDAITYNPDLVEAGYIFVFQDIRGRSMSDGGPFENLNPPRSLRNPDAIDEVTDTNDTIDWLIENVDNHNGRVGIFGNSYKGWTALMGAIGKHKALKAVAAAAPCTDIYFEDFNRYGLFMLAYTPIMDWFGTPKVGRHEGPWWERSTDYFADAKNGLAKDSYDFYLKKGALKNLGGLIRNDNYFWQAIKDHPNYDNYHTERNTLQYLNDIDVPVLITGGWNDEQNLYGIVNSYKTIVRNNPTNDTTLVVGPWTHSDQKTRSGGFRVGNIFYGNGFAREYQQLVELGFFEKHLKDKSSTKTPDDLFQKNKLRLFDTGTKQWHAFETYPSSQCENRTLFLAEKETIAMSGEVDNVIQKNLRFEFISDPAKPVPYIESDEYSMFPAKHFMTDDQRFASKRPDVLTFATDVLEKDMTVFGPGIAQLKFATDHQDADLYVKLIDVYPMDRQPEPTDIPSIKMNGYQQMVRCGYIRGRYRNSFRKPEPFKPNEKSDVNVELLDMFHTFKKGHRIMVQIQSSMFPLFDRNPQKYVENIYLADDSDFERANHTIFGDSAIELKILNTVENNER